MTRKNQSEPPEVQKRILEHFAAFRVPLVAQRLDQSLQAALEAGHSYLVFLDHLLGDLARVRRERAIERRIRHAHFAERATLETFDWTFNAKTFDRLQFEELATADFVRRKDNLILVGQSGLGKSHLIQALGMRACAAGFSVRYASSAGLLAKLNAALADRSLPQALKRFTKPDLLIIDEFGLDRTERHESKDAAGLLYKVIDARSRKSSTALVTNIDFEAWSDYLGDPPLSMALLDRLVDHAIILKLKGRSYRAARAKKTRPEPDA
jgi:DNA replication protein DnaC